MNTKSKIITFIVLLVVAAGAGLFVAGCSKSADKTANASETKTLYTCGMHPQIIQDHPGNCPICGMKLTPIRKQGTNASPAEAASIIAIDPSTIQTMGIRTAEVTRGPLAPADPHRSQRGLRRNRAGGRDHQVQGLD